MYICLQLKFILVYPILMKIEFSLKVSKNPKTKNFIKSTHRLQHADGQKDEANSRISQFCESP
jgi:hypothetical protein